ncbi:MAG TPA: hypothetical protein PJ988_19935 [Anaerolinea sp.]|nr:hypothetical protein [Anaerolinea sp.]
MLAGLLLAACDPAPSAPALPLAPTATNTPEAPFVVALTQQTWPTSTPVSTPENSDDPCDNPFYPVSDEATWVYAMSSGGTATHTMAVDQNDAFTLTVTSDSSDAVFTIDGQCTKEGVVLMENSGSATTYTGEQGSSAVVSEGNSGVTLPKDIAIGQEWTQTLLTNTAIGKAEIDSTYTAIGFENITVPAGNFYTLKIEQNAVIKMGEQNIKMHGFHWYAEGVGTVKSAMDDAPSAELVSFDIPD